MEASNANFGHPYKPYSIQLDFMKSLYSCIRDQKVGIFESPTGTGKSLSLICGALTWLRDHENNPIQGNTGSDDADDWLTQAENAAQRRELLLAREELELKLAKTREDEKRRKQSKHDAKTLKKARLAQQVAGNAPNDDDAYALEEYESDTEIQMGFGDSANGFSSTTQALLDKLRGPAKKEAEEPETDRLKIIFCSRTHSQLTQFVNELRRAKPPSTLSTHNAVDVSSKLEEVVKHLPLGSRKNLCINPKVASLGSTTRVNEQCLELQKTGTTKDKKCQYLPTKEDKEKVEDFRHRTIATIKDIEDVADLGRSMKICPYYASRAAVASSEILTLPYPLLLQKSAREALGVSVKDNVVIIDEAHNLTDAIADTFANSMSLSQLDLAVSQVTAYASRFKNRLKGKNRTYVMQVIRVLNSMTDCLRNLVKSMATADVTITAANLMSGKGVDQIKPHKLLQYLHQSKLCHKVEGYIESQKDEKDASRNKDVLMRFQSFLLALMNPDDEGRFFAVRQDKDVAVRYTLLDPREHFREIVQDARAVILAGGTMSPMSDYSEYLFSYLDKEALRTYSFGHIIPASNLFAQAVVQSPSGIEFDFTFEKRGSEKMLSALGDLVLQTCTVVPDGVVVFFPSYDYLAQVVSSWQKSSVLSALSQVKKIFQESKTISVDELLRNYAAAIDEGKGGLLLSVIGGKLSEGINFSDKLGRAVVAVGLPFPNANGPEWKAKMQHIEGVRYQQCKDQGKTEGESKMAAKAASRECYENACMRAVNQSIGRVIRHKNDYAAILVVDRRFATERIRSKLPGWIRESMEAGEKSWEETEAGLEDFFREKQ